MLLGRALYAQTAATTLSAAERDYDQGKLAGIPGRLQPYMDQKAKEGGFTKPERIRAQKLMTLVYIFTDNEPKAEESLVKLLKLDPEHKLDPRVDPAEFYYLYNKFRTKPIFRLSVKFGANKSLPNVIESYGPFNTAEYRKYYNGATDGDSFDGQQGTLGIGYWAELAIERHILYGVEAGLGFQLRQSRYDVDQKINESPLVTYIANEQVYFRTPLYLRYNYRYFSDTGPIPYVSVGASFDYLIDAYYAEATRQGGTSFSPTNTINLKQNDQVKNYNITMFGALGAKFRIKTHFLTFEARYEKGMLNYINPENRWNGGSGDNSLQAGDLAFVEDDLALDFITFSIGYTHSIYSPKKLKEYR